MFIPQMVGLLAGAVLVVAAILAATQARRGARVLACIGFGLAIVGVGLAIETEARYRACRDDRLGPSAQETLDRRIDEQLNALSGRATELVFEEPACERSPW